MQKWCFSPEGHPQHCVHRPVYVAHSLIDCCSEPSPSPAEARRFRLYVSSTLRRHSPSRCLPYRWPPQHYPDPTRAYPPTCPIWSCNARTRRLATHRLAVVVSAGVGVCQSSTPDYNRVQTTVDDRTAGWYTTHLSNIRATLGSRSCPYSLCPKRLLCRRASALGNQPFERPAGTDDHA